MLNDRVTVHGIARRAMRVNLALLVLSWLVCSGRAQVAEAWIARHSPGGSKAVAVDSVGNVYVAGGGRNAERTGLEFVTLKYDRQGNEQWVRSYDDPRPDYHVNYTQTMALDGESNAFVTGTSCIVRGLGAFYCDYMTLKYDKAGQLQWVALYGGPARGYNVAKAIAVDAEGNPYVTGLSGHAVAFEYATIKYDGKTGRELWVARYHGQADGDAPEAIVLDAQGHVYVTGMGDQMCEGRCQGGNYVTIKYDGDGQEQWVARYSPSRSTHQAKALAVDSEGHVYVTGTSRGCCTVSDYATVKYDADGNQLWVARYSGVTDGLHIAYAIGVDGEGHVYVTGESQARVPEFNFNYVTIQYDGEGQEQWVARYEGPSPGWDTARALTIDSEGDVYVTGSSAGADLPRRYDFATIKYNPSGQEQWVARYEQGGASAMALDGDGNVYVTGGDGSVSGGELVTIKYVQNGKADGSFDPPGGSPPKGRE